MCEYYKNDGYYNRNKSLISKTLKNNVDIDLSINVKDKKIVASIENLAMSIEDDNWFLPTKKINYCLMCRTKTSRGWTKFGRKGSDWMTNRISKKKIKTYIKWLEEEYEKRSKKLERLQKINDKEETMYYDLREDYERLAEYKGEIRASCYISNNC